MLDLVLIPRLAELSGHTIRAIQSKMGSRKFVEGKHFIKDPDDRVHFSLRAYEAWVVGKPAEALPALKRA